MATGIEVLLDVALLVVWGYAFYQSYRLSHELFGGQYTSVIMYFVASIGLFTLMQVMEAAYQHFITTLPEYSMTFVFSLQVVQVVAGLLMIRGFYGIYQVAASSAGIEEVLNDG